MKGFMYLARTGKMYVNNCFNVVFLKYVSSILRVEIVVMAIHIK